MDDAPDRPTESTPSPKATTPDEVWPRQQHDWILQQLTHILRDVGQLTEAVRSLQGTTAQIEPRLRSIENKISWFTGVGICAIVLITAFVGFLGWLFDGRTQRLTDALLKMAGS